MNAPERLGLRSVLGALSLSYSPVVDARRRVVGTRLTLLAARPQDRIGPGLMLAPLTRHCPETTAPVLIALLDAEFDATLLDWDAPPNAVVEIPAMALRDPDVQALVQRARRGGLRLALRGRPTTPLPPALLDCFEVALIHMNEDRRRRKDGTNAPAPPGVRRRLPFLITGTFETAELETAYARGAIGSVGVPSDDDQRTLERPAQPAQASVLELLRMTHDRASVERMEAVVRNDPALTFELLRFAGPGALEAFVDGTAITCCLAALGHAGVGRWLSRLLRVCSADAHAAPLTYVALRRAAFVERLGTMTGEGAALADAPWLAGALSLLDRATGVPFERLLQRAALPAAARTALVERAGPCAPYLELAVAMERSDPAGVRRHAAALGLAVEDCNRALLDALAAAPSSGTDEALPTA